ncbi:hypothetical protein VTK73DRAFT_9730 [Phialemonium thermophilum]|uniref:Uncharacterized protein n=1 Tax=Phialemonium thermophilum TaxID=223376 RepID=A0ABR3W101_9PEZI
MTWEVPNGNPGLFPRRRATIVHGLCRCFDSGVLLQGMLILRRGSIACDGDQSVQPGLLSRCLKFKAQSLSHSRVAEVAEVTSLRPPFEEYISRYRE